MRKLFFAINITIDGYADHTAVIADEELHDFYTDLLKEADTVIFGRNTYQLMESFWPAAHEIPGSTPGMLRFADRINKLQKIVFSKTLSEASWENTSLNNGNAVEEIIRLKKLEGRSISVGGISLAANLMNAGLIDDYWFVVQPILLGKGKLLTKNIEKRKDLELADTLKFRSGAVVLHYVDRSSF